MLTEQDKEQIFQEEMYRREIREQVEKGDTEKKKRGRDVWAFFNSPFFLWILSSIFLGVISFFYANWDKQRTLEQEQREKTALVERENNAVIRKLDAEISNRLNYFVNSIHYGQLTLDNAVTSRPETVFIFAATRLEKAVIGLEDPTTINYKVNVFPEHANRSLRSLLLELQSIVPDNEKQEIDIAYKQSVILQSIYLRSIDIKQVDHGKDILEDQQFIELQELDKVFNLKRWGEPFSSAKNNMAELLTQRKRSKGK